MAPPNPPNQPQNNANVASLLNEVINQLKIVNKTDKTLKKAQSDSKSSRNREKLAKDLDNIVEGTDKYNKQLDKADKEFKDIIATSKTLSKSFADTVKDAIIPGRKMMKDSMKEWNDSLNKTIRDQGANHKDIAKGAQEYIKTNKDASNTIRQGIGAYKDYINVVRSISSTRKKMTQQEGAQIASLRGVMDELKTTSNGALDVWANNIKMTKAQSEAMAKLTAGHAITTKQLKTLQPVLDKVGQNFDVITKVTEDYNTNYGKSQKDLHEQISKSWKGLMGDLKTILLTSGRVIFKDLVSQAQNAVGTSSYAKIISGNMGVSQSELSEFVGRNRINLRSMGGGKALAPVENGQIAEMQKSIRQTTGLTGEANLKYLGKTMDSMISMGAPAKDAAKAANDLYLTMQKSNMSFDEFNDMVSDLSKSPAFVDMSRANGYNNQAKQIDIFTRILTATNYSKEYLKSILDINQQSKYQGIGDMVKAQVGTRLEENLINQYRPGTFSKGDIALNDIRARGGSDSLPSVFNTAQFKKLDFGNGETGASKFKTKEDLQAYYAATLPQKMTGGSRDIQNDLGARGGGLELALFNTRQQINTGLMGGMAGMINPNESIMAAAKTHGLTGNEKATTQQQDMLTGANDQLIKSIFDVNNQFQLFGSTMNDWVLKFQSFLTGASKNPLGQAGGAILGAGKDALSIGSSWMALRLLGKAMPGAGAAAPGGLGGLGGIGGGAIAGGLAGLGGAGLGGFVSGGSKSGIAGGAVGGIIGQLIAKRALAMLLGRAVGGVLGSAAGPLGAVGGGLLGGYLVDKAFNAFSSSPSTAQGTAGENPITESAASPQGDTAGELLTKITQQLNDIYDTAQKQLSLTDTIHKENIDFMTQQAMERKVHISRITQLEHLND
ncbi:MAG: hypothetical protein JWP44_5054 [Mucilaginibacter sp.]|nr:hypothetical protein [Mucilaginibacter sp.]